MARLIVVAYSWNRYNGHISIVPPHRSIRVGAWDSITELDILVQGNYKKFATETRRKTIRKNGKVANEGKITNFTGMHRIFRIYIYPVYLVYPCLNSSPFPFFLLFSLIFFTFCLSLCHSVSSVLQWLKLGFCSQSFDTTLSRIISATPSFDIWGIS